ncbi:MAG TPA: T9SS type A sorting domain-containing protein, partial [bacterium]|nr:T9SS type A sorting domain-containing protein [bacterium]
IALPVWPEENPRDGDYRIPVPVPAPVIMVENTSIGQVRLTWKDGPDRFTHPRLTGALREYRIYRSDAGMGPWALLATLPAGQTTGSGLYEYIDADPVFKLGERRYYSVVSVNDQGHSSGRTNITRHDKNVASVAKLGEVFVAPNPFNIESGFGGKTGAEDKIGFYGLPERCTIRIFSYAGQLIQTIEHNEPVYTTAWFQVTRNEQEIASGIYLYVITTPGGDRVSGKFIIVK